ncbi:MULTISPECIES: NUDIX domain-containing protein [Halorussus]|uniref:NUDIX domain-containing protein n=1 Tax=Halorussus TaxID=1070314 RepID=UPI000E21221A|nr:MULTISPECIES: NUDIX domain-containing protein [Halorussus]NHN60894.1 NUDIX domain-containing protein [Halorussus sp. JP-T4]
MTQEVADYCPYCGGELADRRTDDRERRYCPACERVVYHNPTPGADVTVVRDDSALLVRRAAPPGAGEWTVPGGHLEADEHPRVGVVRELREEAGVSVAPGTLTLVGTDLLDSTGEKYVLNVGFAVRASESTGEPTAGTDASSVRFFHADELADDGYDLRPHVRDRVEAAMAALD